MTKKHGQNENPAPKIVRPRDVPTPGKRLYITQRDQAILYDVFLHNAMRRQDIQTRHFTSLQRANSRLAMLFHGKFLERIFLPLSPHPEISYGTQIVYQLGIEGVPIVARLLGWPEARVRERQRTLSQSFVVHTLEIVAFHLALEATIATQQELSLIDFFPELLARHEYEVRAPSGEWRTEIFKPDSVFLLEKKERIYGYSLEIDLGNSSQKVLLGKAAISARYEAAGLFEKRYETESFITLFVTTSETRRDNMLAIFHGTDRCWLTTFSALRERSVLDAIWHIPGRKKLAKLGEDGTF